MGLRPKRRLGQNFLHDDHQMSRVVTTAAIQAGDVILEVGVGTGQLSHRLLSAGARLVAVEIDPDLEPIVRRHLSAYGQRATIIIGDVLAGKHVLNPDVVTALGSAINEAFGGNSAGSSDGFKLVANLPYAVASPLLANLVTRPGPPRMDQAVVMVQREVADRLCASPGGKDFGALGALIQSVTTVRRIAVVGAGCFWPRPKVESAIVQLLRRPKPLTTDPLGLARTLQVLFGKRRKQVGTILGRRVAYPMGIDPHQRPEALTVEQLVALSDWLSQPHEH